MTRPMLLVAVLATCLTTHAQDLSVGDDAPPLNVDTWVKGESVPSFERNHVYVVEFWATWCGPCLAGIPHLTELQDKYDGDLTIIGVSTQDTRGNNLGSVRNLVNAQGDRMDYTVAFCNSRTTWSDWMGAAGRNGIPSAFLVGPEGNIDWIGHPSRIDDALAKSIGRIDRSEQREADPSETREAVALKNRIASALEEEDTRAAIASMSRLTRIDPIRYAGWEVQRIGLLITQNERAASTQVRTALTRTYKAHPGESAWVLATVVRSASGDRLQKQIEPDVERLLAEEPTDPRTMLLAAEVKIRDGEIERAMQELQIARAAIDEARLLKEPKTQLAREIMDRIKQLNEGD